MFITVCVQAICHVGRRPSQMAIFEPGNLRSLHWLVYANLRTSKLHLRQKYKVTYITPVDYRLGTDSRGEGSGETSAVLISQVDQHADSQGQTMTRQCAREKRDMSKFLPYERPTSQDFLDKWEVWFWRRRRGMIRGQPSLNAKGCLPPFRIK